MSLLKSRQEQGPLSQPCTVSQSQIPIFPTPVGLEHQPQVDIHSLSIITHLTCTLQPWNTSLELTFILSIITRLPCTLQPHWVPETLPVCHVCRLFCNRLLLSGNPFPFVTWLLLPHTSARCLFRYHLLRSPSPSEHPQPLLWANRSPHIIITQLCLAPLLGCAPSEGR